MLSDAEFKQIDKISSANITKNNYIYENQSSKKPLYKVVYPYEPQNDDELELKEGDFVRVLEICDDGWFIGLSDNRFGTFPGNYVEKI